MHLAARPQASQFALGGGGGGAVALGAGGGQILIGDHFADRIEIVAVGGDEA